MDSPGRARTKAELEAEATEQQIRDDALIAALGEEGRTEVVRNPVGSDSPAVPRPSNLTGIDAGVSAQGQNYMDESQDSMLGYTGFTDADIIVAIDQKFMDEKKIWQNVVKVWKNTTIYRECIRRNKKPEDVLCQILCYMAYGYWGANKKVDERDEESGIRIVLFEKTYNISTEFKIYKGKPSDKEARKPEVITASKLARVGTSIAYRSRDTAIAKNSPQWKYVRNWKNQADIEYVQIHGYLLPLKYKDWGAEKNNRCLAINFDAHLKRAPQEIRASLVKKFVKISTLCACSVTEIVKIMKENSSSGMNSDELTIFLDEKYRGIKPKKSNKTKIAGATFPVEED